ncbi:hypothetical protein [Streptomyces sp. NPDC018584]|uniref:hypothetical protein n=1 Tax=unclassified Streptomyces TaxID=2593676 RepID=UPI00379D4080
MALGQERLQLLVTDAARRRQHGQRELPHRSEAYVRQLPLLAQGRHQRLPHLDALRRSAVVFDALRAEWEQALGARRLGELESGLRTVVPPDALRLDAAGWLGGS